MDELTKDEIEMSDRCPCCGCKMKPDEKRFWGHVEECRCLGPH